MLLTIDIGNSNIAFGIFNKEKLLQKWRIKTDTKTTVDEYELLLSNLINHAGYAIDQITDASMCSVVPNLTETLYFACKKWIEKKPLVVKSGIKTGIKLLVDNPREVGADRVADVVGTYNLYGGPSILVDFGTHTVFNAISTNGEFLGGSIAPGITMSAESLFINSSQLGKVELIAPNSVIAKSTSTNIQSGLIYGYVALVEGMVEKMKNELGPNTSVIGTGGLIQLISNLTTVFDNLNLDITLIGLKYIYEMNK
jgi:type III pantothenate kinase